MRGYFFIHRAAIMAILGAGRVFDLKPMNLKTRIRPRIFIQMNDPKKNLWTSIAYPLAFVVLMWAVKIIEHSFNVSFHTYGLLPREPEGLVGIVTSPFLHGDFEHLVSNTFPVLILGFAILSVYRSLALRVFSWIYLLTGFWVWTAARHSYHIGASGIIYGMISFLFFMGLFRRDTRSIALSLLVTFLYGSFIWGIFPIEAGVSWESHMLGAIAGLFCAILYRNVDRPVVPQPTDEETELPYWRYEVEGELKPPEPQETPNVKYIYKPGPGKSNNPSD